MQRITIGAGFVVALIVLVAAAGLAAVGQLDWKLAGLFIALAVARMLP